jgi:hypothetical protein
VLLLINRHNQQHSMCTLNNTGQASHWGQGGLSRVAAAGSPAGCEPPPASAEPWLPPVCWEAHRNRALKPCTSRKAENQATLSDEMSGCGAAVGHQQTCIYSPFLSFPCCKQTDSSPVSTLTTTNPTQALLQAYWQQQDHIHIPCYKHTFGGCSLLLESEHWPSGTTACCSTPSSPSCWLFVRGRLLSQHS